MTNTKCKPTPAMVAWLIAGTMLGLGSDGPPPSSSGPLGALRAEIHNSGFPPAHDTYNGLSAASDGKIYYVLSTDLYGVGARMYVFDPASQRIRNLGDLTEACGEKGHKAIVKPQGQ
jgi:hypothetical protein